MFKLTLLTVITILSFVVFQTSKAQKEPIKFGKVSEEDIQMTVFPADSTADAVILCDYGTSKLEYNDQEKWFLLYFHRICRIKILSKEGLDWANLNFSIYNSGTDNEKTSQLRGATYNIENGKIIKEKLKNSGIFREEVNKNWTDVKISMPSVKVGSVIDIEYSITSPFYWELREWKFQYDIPVLHSEYRVIIPEYYDYKNYSQGYLPFDINEQVIYPGVFTATSSTQGFNGKTTTSSRIEYQATHNRWVMKDVPAFKSEAFMPPETDYYSKIYFELASSNFMKVGGSVKNYTNTWEAINRQLLNDENFGIQLKRKGVVKDAVSLLSHEAASDEQKIVAIYNYVRTTMKWDGRYSIQAQRTLRDAYNKGTGNSGDINLLLTLMLKTAGLEAEPVVLSTRSHGRLFFNYPTISQFNYVICYVKTSTGEFLLDATDGDRPAGLLPTRCLNGKGRIISETDSKWINLYSGEISGKSVNTILNITDSGKLEGEVQYQYKSLDAYKKRKTVLSQGIADYRKKFKEKNPAWEIEKHSFKNDSNIYKPFIEEYTLKTSEHVQSAGNLLYLNPFIVEQQKENPFHLEKRVYPVDFIYPMSERYIANITLPDGYSVESIPEAAKILLPDKAGQFVFNISQLGNKLQLVTMINIKKVFYTTEEYPLIKEFFDKIVEKQAEQIVLKKI